MLVVQRKRGVEYVECKEKAGKGKEDIHIFRIWSYFVFDCILGMIIVVGNSNVVIVM